MLWKFDGGRSEQVLDIVMDNETFVSQYHLEAKQQPSAWLFPGERPPVKFKGSRSTSRQIIAVLFAKSSNVTSALLQERKTVNVEWYINICLLKVFEVCCPNNGICSVLRHHNNPSAHTASTTPYYLEANRIQLITQTPYLLDLPPCDFFLFPRARQQLKGVGDAQ